MSTIRLRVEESDWSVRPTGLGRQAPLAEQGESNPVDAGVTRRTLEVL